MMIQREFFRSLSGLRPMSAFVVIGLIILLAAGRVSYLVRVAGADAGHTLPVQQDLGMEPGFDVVDTEGRVLASFLPRFSLEMSPRSMWRAHTPDRFAKRLAAALGRERDVPVLLAGFFPDAVNGTVQASLDLDLAEAAAIDSWLGTGNGTDRGTLPGMRVVARGEQRWGVAWEPAIVLAETTRGRFGYSRASSWTRDLSLGIADCLTSVEDSTRPTGPLAEMQNASRIARQEQERVAAVWAALMPSAWHMYLDDLPPDRVQAVRRMLRDEWVWPLQMSLNNTRERAYPAGRFEVLGSWGYTRASPRMRVPREGLERMGDRLLSSLESGHPAPAAYTFSTRRPIRGERQIAWHGFQAGDRASAVVTCLDIDLQRRMRVVLEEIMAEHRPALAMGIAVDVESGAVLAVDSVEAWSVAPFAPVFYAFTPGSILKVVTMASALDLDLVRPGSRIDVGQGEFSVPDSSRVIREAEGSKSGIVTAADCLAHSNNAGMVQIGLRVPDQAFHGRLKALGYGARPGVGLGPEAGGHLADLPWSRAYTHASIAFGHEFTTTLWQHAAALSAILRGGEWKPLRLIDSVAAGDRRVDVLTDSPRRVFQEKTCATIRAMMNLGAREGTGRSVYRPDLVLGTKTGTAEKVPSELCAHVVGAARKNAAATGRALTRAEWDALRHAPRPHRGCYTSSMCVHGRSPADGREVMVLVVVEEPRGRERFGSRVAGPAALAILEQALGSARDGRPTVADLVPGFAASQRVDPTPSARPWMSGEMEGRGF